MAGGSRQVALFRGLNVAGHQKVAMPALCALAERLGLGDVRAYIQSGNLVFRGDRRTAATLEPLLEAQATKSLGFRTSVFVRAAKDLAALVAANPFADFAEADPSHLVVLFTKAAPTKAKVEALRTEIKGPELVAAKGRHLYVTYPDGIGRSRLTIQVIESRLGTEATGRNWNTVLKLLALSLEGS